MASNSTEEKELCGKCQMGLAGGTKVTYKGQSYCEKCFRMQLYGRGKGAGEGSAEGQPVGLTAQQLVERGCRAEVVVAGRALALFCTRDGREVFCCDGLCYHAGGPLADGDIEDSGDPRFGLAVRCPWHGYRISLRTGEGFWQSPDGLCSKGPKQRVHHVAVAADGSISVRLSDLSRLVPSDDYYPVD